MYVQRKYNSDSDMDYFMRQSVSFIHYYLVIFLHSAKVSASDHTSLRSMSPLAPPQGQLWQYPPPPALPYYIETDSWGAYMESSDLGHFAFHFRNGMFIKM